MTRQSFLQGAFILFLAGLISKALGAFYRIPFSHIVGPEGIGLYQMAYPIYTMLLALSSAGIPVAISKLVAENSVRGNRKGCQKVFRLALFLLAGTGLFFSLLLFFSAEFLAEGILRDSRAYYSIIAISPAIFVVAVMSVFRGYFQGLQLMWPTAVSQIIEQVFRIGTVFLGAYFFLAGGVAIAAAAATFGAVTGALAALIFLVGVYISQRRGDYISQITPLPKTLPILKNLLFLALPISLGGMVMPSMQTIDAIIVPMKLQEGGYTVSQATGLYGQLSGMAFTLANLPTVVTLSLATSLVPSISRAAANRNFTLLHKYAGGAVRLTFLLCLPAAIGLILLAEPLSGLLFDCAEAGMPLMFLAPGAIFLGLHQVTSGILQGLGKTGTPVVNLLVGAGFKLVSNFILTGAFGIMGAALGTVIGFAVASALNFLAVVYYIGWTLEVKDHLLKPLIAATIMGVVVNFSLKSAISWGDPAGVLFAVICGCISYVMALLLIGGIKRGDLQIIPGVGSGLLSILNRMGLIRG